MPYRSPGGVRLRLRLRGLHSSPSLRSVDRNRGDRDRLWFLRGTSSKSVRPFAPLLLNFFSSFLALFPCFLSSFFRRLSALSSLCCPPSCLTLLSELEDEATGAALAPVAAPWDFDEGSNPLVKIFKHEQECICSGGTYNATAKASASISLIFLISSALSSAPCPASRLYQWISLFFCQRPVGALILWPR